MAHWKPVEQVQDLVNKMGGDAGISRFLSGELILVPRDPASLLKLGEPVVFPAVSWFAGEAFNKATGFVRMNDDFRRFILPVVEKNVSEAAIQVFELTHDVRNLAIAAELKVHERGELALAHFFQAIQGHPRTDSWVASFVIGNDSETWAVYANLFSDGWHVSAYQLGNRDRRRAGGRFLSRCSLGSDPER